MPAAKLSVEYCARENRHEGHPILTDGDECARTSVRLSGKSGAPHGEGGCRPSLLDVQWRYRCARTQSEMCMNAGDEAPRRGCGR